MATSTVEKIQCRIKLDNGTDAQGNVKTLSVSFPTVSVSGYTDARFLAVSQAVQPCLTHTIYSLEKITTEGVEDE